MTAYTDLFVPVAEASVEPTAVAAPAYSLLIVDDEPNVCSALKRVFSRENYRILVAADGKEALSLLAKESAQVVLSDYMMPVMNGAEFLKHVRSRYPETIRIMLTGHADVNAVMGGIKDGAVYKFILKPWNDDDLRVSVALAIEQYDLQLRNKELLKQNARDAHEIQELSRLAVTNRSQLAIMLHKRNLLSAQQIQELHRLQLTRKEPMIKLLFEKNWISEKELRAMLRKELMVEEIRLDEIRVDPAVSALVPRSLCEKQWVIPLKQTRKQLLLAMADPLDEGLIDSLRFHTEMDIQPVMADCGAVRAKIEEVYGAKLTAIRELESSIPGNDPSESIEIVIEHDDEASFEDLLRETEEPSAVRLVNAIILEAIRLGASDIHIEPRLKHVIVRYRLDGVLVDQLQVPNAVQMALVSRIKIMAELDIAERRRPQDGRVTVKSPLKVVDLRISTLPTVSGEKVVLRLLERNATVHAINVLGLTPTSLNQVLRVVSKPQGIVLATGPTGSGKTTTLYSLLQHEASASKNYVTIEDPVEYYLDMASQVAVKEKTGLTFAKVLRSILRQDPDVILLGEIRDQETAEVAFQAALTGHLVFSTLHTRSTIATLARLFDLGLKPHTVASALEAVIAQRLVRRNCPECSEQAPDAAAAGDTGQEPGRTFRGKGCLQCHYSGYRGRMGIYEILILDDEIRHLLAGGASIKDIEQAARAKGMRSLMEDAAEKIQLGLTTMEEVARVIGPRA